MDEDGDVQILSVNHEKDLTLGSMHMVFPAYYCDADRLHPSPAVERHPLSAARRRQLLECSPLGRRILKRIETYEFGDWMP